jgi:hypothetical protein
MSVSILVRGVAEYALFLDARWKKCLIKDYMPGAEEPLCLYERIKFESLWRTEAYLKLAKAKAEHFGVQLNTAAAGDEQLV